MSDHPPRPPGKDPKMESNLSSCSSTSLSEPASTQFNAPNVYPTTNLFPWDPNGPARERQEQERREQQLQEQERQRRFRELERSNPYRPDWERSRSRSPTRSYPPIRQRDPYHEFGPPPRRLPPFSDILSPPHGIQSRESSIRSTVHASPPAAASSPTPTNIDAMNDPRRAVLQKLRPFTGLSSHPEAMPYSTPCPTRQGLTAHRETFLAAENPYNCDDAHQETSPGVEDNEAEDDQEEDETSSAEGPCEFTSPCTLDPSPDGKHFRKVISHVFGRNKSSTKLIPERVWVQYCRKHYQRARYRVDQWPFTQCTLILESLNRMKEWGGIQSFELILRRRELQRLEEGEAAQARAANSSELLPSGRKHPTAIVSPVPVWLREQRGRQMSFDQIRNLIVEVRNYMVQLRQQEIEREANETGNAPNPGNANNTGNSKKSGNAKKTDNAQKSGNAKKTDNAKPADNTEKSGNASKKPDEVRKNASCVRFPDVEILPRFHKWVIDDALRKRAAAKAAKTAKGKVNKAANNEEKKEEHQEQSQSDEGYDEANNGENTAPARVAGGLSADAIASIVGPDLEEEGIPLTESGRRRSERIFLRMVEGKSTTRVSDRGSVKKPRKKE